MYYQGYFVRIKFLYRRRRHSMGTHKESFYEILSHHRYDKKDFEISIVDKSDWAG